MLNQPSLETPGLGGSNARALDGRVRRVQNRGEGSLLGQGWTRYRKSFEERLVDRRQIRCPFGDSEEVSLAVFHCYQQREESRVKFRWIGANAKNMVLVQARRNLSAPQASA